MVVYDIPYQVNAVFLQGQRECKDQDKNCSTWAANKDCLRYNEFMKKDCNESCQLCGEDQGKRKAELNGDTDQSEQKKIRVPIDIPLSCLTTRVETPSDVELLTRLFPNQHRYLLEMILQGCYGNILHAIQVITRSSPPLSNSSSGGTPPSQPLPTSTQPPTGSEPPSLVNYGGLLSNAYRYLYPGVMPPPSYMFPGSPSLSYFRPYFPKYTTTSTPVQLNSGNQSDQHAGEDVPTSHYKQEYNSLEMTPSPSPQREETEVVCQKCNHKQKNDKMCEQCGQNNQLIDDHRESI